MGQQNGQMFTSFGARYRALRPVQRQIVDVLVDVWKNQGAAWLTVEEISQRVGKAVLPGELATLALQQLLVERQDEATATGQWRLHPALVRWQREHGWSMLEWG